MTDPELDALRAAQRFEWHFGSTTAWASYTRVLAARLMRAGIDARREKRTYYEDPATTRWVVSVLESDKRRATDIADSIEHYAWGRRQRAPKWKNGVRLAA